MQQAVPAPTAATQIEQAVRERPRTDYIFEFWTAFGWMVLTLGVYSFYVFYQLFRRSRDHIRRRTTVLGAAEALAWERAGKQGKTETIRPAFDDVRRPVDDLQRMNNDFRDPALWTLFSIIGGILVWGVGVILLDQDLVRHERDERAAEARLTDVFAELGVALPVPDPATKQAHNYVGRVIATIVTFGFYSLWWLADVMREGNVNFEQDNVWEDALVASLSND